DQQRVGPLERAVRDDLVAGTDADEVADDELLDRQRTCCTARVTVATGATSALSRSSARFARTSRTVPIPAFAPSTTASRGRCPAALGESACCLLLAQPLGGGAHSSPRAPA